MCKSCEKIEQNSAATEKSSLARQSFFPVRYASVPEFFSCKLRCVGEVAKKATFRLFSHSHCGLCYFSTVGVRSKGSIYYEWNMSMDTAKNMGEDGAEQYSVQRGWLCCTVS